MVTPSNQELMSSALISGVRICIIAAAKISADVVGLAGTDRGETGGEAEGPAAGPGPSNGRMGPPTASEELEVFTALLIKRSHSIISSFFLVAKICIDEDEL